MKTNRTITGWLALAALAIFNLQPATVFAQTTAFTYQGRVMDNGTNFTGAGQFKFALVTSTNANHTATATAVDSSGFITSYILTSGGSGYVTAPAVTVFGGGGSGATATASISGGVVTGVNVVTPGSGYTSTPTVTIAAPPANITYTTYWSNDGTSSAGSQPTAAAGVAVNNGLFTVVLGDTTVANMQAIQPSLFIQPSLQLRIWFSDGVNAFAALTPLQNLTPAPYAIMANSASNLLGALPLSQLSAGTANINISGNAATATTANNFSGSLSGDVTGTQGATVVVTVGGQTAANVAGGASAANAATSANTANTIVKRDASGNFSADTITLDANLNLPATTATAGIIYFGGSPLIHAYGTQNFFAGSGAGNLTMSGSGGNTGVGYQALQNNTNGYYNTACGDDALYANTTGFDNTAFGRNALYANTVGYFNTACGNNALKTNSTGYANVACGVDALYANTTGWANTAIGTAVLYINTTVSCNTGIGNSAISYNTTGNSNTAVGFSALLNCSNGICNIALGSQAGQNITTGSYNIDIGNQGVSTDNNIIRIGDVQTATYLAGTVYATGNPGFSGSCSTYCGNGVYGIINSTCGAGVMGQANSGAAHGVIAAYGSDGNHICYLGNANSAADLHGNVYVTGNVGIGTGSSGCALERQRHGGQTRWRLVEHLFRRTVEGCRRGLYPRAGGLGKHSTRSLSLQGGQPVKSPIPARICRGGRPAGAKRRPRSRPAEP